MVLFRCAYPWRPLAAILVAYVKLIKCPCFVEIIPVVENSSSGCRQINPCVWILLWYLAKEIWTKGLDSFTRMHYRKSWCQAPEAAVTVERCLHKSLVKQQYFDVTKFCLWGIVKIPSVYSTRTLVMRRGFVPLAMQTPLFWLTSPDYLI